MKAQAADVNASVSLSTTWNVQLTSLTCAALNRVNQQLCSSDEIIDTNCLQVTPTYSIYLH